jgi:hypothetical protein
MRLSRAPGDGGRMPAVALRPMAPPRARAQLAVLWRTWRRRRELDRQLAAGADPDSSPEMKCRARQLSGASSRCALAAELESIVAAVEEDPITSRLAIDLRIEDVRAVSDDLRELAMRLQAPCAVRGMALCRWIVRDPLSPLYEPVPAGELRRAVRAARQALEPRSPSAITR